LRIVPELSSEEPGSQECQQGGINLQAVTGDGPAEGVRKPRGREAMKREFHLSRLSVTALKGSKQWATPVVPAGKVFGRTLKLTEAQKRIVDTGVTQSGG